MEVNSIAEMGSFQNIAPSIFTASIEQLAVSSYQTSALVMQWTEQLGTRHHHTSIDLWGFTQNPALAAIKVRMPGSETPPPTPHPGGVEGAGSRGDGVGLPLRVTVGGVAKGEPGFAAGIPANLLG